MNQLRFRGTNPLSPASILRPLRARCICGYYFGLCALTCIYIKKGGALVLFNNDLIMSKLTARLAIGFIVAVLIIAGINYINLQRPLAQIEDADERNKGIVVFAHYKYFVHPNVLVYDLRNVDDTSSPMDVTRVLLQFAARQKDKQFSTIELSFRGEQKFVLQGDYFRKLGQEYGEQNPAYTLRTLPENVYKTDGTKAFGEWAGGLLGVLARQMEDFGSWHRAWYIDDLAADANERADRAS